MSKKNEVGKPLARYENTLDVYMEKGKNAIPESVNADRLKMNALMAITEDSKLMQEAVNQPQKIAQFVYNAVLQGLDLLNREAYILNYGGKLQMVLDYKAEKKLALQYSVKPIKQILSGVVKENDEHSFNDEGHFLHKYSPFDSEKDRGAIIGAYCTIFYQDGTREDTFVNNEEIEKVKNVSPSSKSNYSPWVRWKESMIEKTVIKKAMKSVYLDFANTEQQKAYMDSNQDVVFDNERKSEQETVVQDDAFDYIDAEYEENSDEEVVEVVVDLD